MTKRCAQAGFTLIELMLSSILGGILLISAFGILYDSIGFADVMRIRASLNAQARENFDLLLDGGISDGQTVYGLHGVGGTIALPSPAGLINGNRVSLNTVAAGAPAASLAGTSIAGTNITCVADDDPVPVCEGAGPLAVDGFLGDLPVLYGTADSRSVNDRTSELQLRLFSAYNLNRVGTTSAQSVEIYRTIFTLNQDVLP